ncbi:MAG: MotA/TolQ/ExbB proton channel family protein [Planctomycetes bacterium]|nr:MotA/TolQ/ExbB proton channel family protein [Planctomycetota bacterium]
MFWDASLIDLFKKGGFVMWPLLACSLAGLAIVLERAFYFFRLRLRYDRFLGELKSRLSRGSANAAVEYCRTYANPVPHVAAEYMLHLENDSEREEALKCTGSYAIEKVEAHLRPLATIAHIAPLLGLLGTVTGLVSAFHRIESLGGQVQPEVLAGGIWEALITTVAGLLIAIPCMAFYRTFEGIVDRVARRMHLVVSELNRFFGKRSGERLPSEEPAKTWRKTQAAEKEGAVTI